MTESIHRATRHYIAGRALNLALAPVSIIVLPGMLGDLAYARYAYWFGLISIYIVLLDMGSQVVLRRYLPEFISSNKSCGATLFASILKFKLLPLTLLIIGILFTSNPVTLLLLVCTALFATLLNSLADVYYAAQRMGKHVLVLAFKKLLRLILVPIFFLIWQVPGILIALLLAELIPLLFGLNALKLLKNKSRTLDKPFMFYCSFGFIGFVTFLLATLIGRSPVFLAEWSNLDLAATGHIALAVDVTYFALKEFINSLSESILPKLIEYKTKRQESAYQNLINRNYRFVNFTAMLFIAVGLPLIPGFLPLLGSHFYLASNEVQILLVSVLFGSWNAIHNQILITHDQATKIALAYLAAFLTLCLTTTLFFPHAVNILNLTLALFTTLFVLALTGFLLALPYRRINHTHDHTKNDAFYCFIRLLPATLITAISLFYWQPKGLLMLSIAAISGSCLYLAVVIINRGLNESDLGHLKKSLLNR